jgi:hypothetical protein
MSGRLDGARGVADLPDSGEEWYARASSLPGSLRLAASSLGGELSRMRSFFIDPPPAASPYAPAQSPHHSLVPAPDDADAVTRLEVLAAPEVNFTVLCLYGATGVALVYVVLVTRAARASWALSNALTLGPVWAAASGALRAALNALSLALPLLFGLRLATARRVCNEQVWTACLLAAGLFCENPLTDAFYSLGTLRRAGEDGPVAAAVANAAVATRDKHHAAGLVICDAAYTVVIYLYLLLSAHSYRVLDGRDYSRAFYLPKLVAAAVYFAVKLALGFGFRVALGLIPFSRLLVLFYLGDSGRGSARLAVPVLLTTACDALFVAWVMREVRATADALARVPYLENRGKQLGFRCFVYQSLLLVSNLLLVATVLDANLPREVLYRSYDWSVDPARPGRFIQLEPPVGQLALAFVYVTWNVIVAYVNLPPGPLMPYTVTALRNLCTALLPSALTARHRWPAWVPGHSPREPDDGSDSEDAEDDVAAAAADAALPRSSSTGSVRESSRALQLDAGTAVAFGAHEEAAAAAASWRAGVPRGELCPLRYRHREWHAEAPATGLSAPFAAPPAPMHQRPEALRGTPPPSPPRVSVDVKHSGEAGDAGDTLLANTLVRRDRVVVPLSSAESSSPVPTGSGAVHAAEAPDALFDTPRSHLDSQDFLAFSRTLSPPPPPPPAGRGRLLTRKNLFVLETQVALANAMYLCYIPGNTGEERAKDTPAVPLGKDFGNNLGSFADGLEELGMQLDDEKQAAVGLTSGTRATASEPDPPCQRNGRDYALEHDLGTYASTGLRPVSSVPHVMEAASRPDSDDGGMFLVDPAEMAAKHGYLLYRHIRHDESNGHAIVLVGQDRVIVAFSGTRDAKNWVTNSRFMRVPWDDMFRNFAGEASGTDPTIAANPPAASPEGAPRGGSGGRAEKSPPAPDASNESDGLPRAFSGSDSARRHSLSVTGLAGAGGDAAGEGGAQVAASPTAGPTGPGRSAGRPLHRSRSEDFLVVGELDGLLRRSQAAARTYGSTRNAPRSAAKGRGFSGGESARPRASPPISDALLVNVHGRARRRAWSRSRPNVSGIEDVAASLAQEIVTYGQAKVHLGFAQAYDKLRDRVMGALLELYGGRHAGATGRAATESASSQVPHGPRFERDVDGNVTGVERGSCRGLPLFFTGHSLGGALASFASYEAARHYRRLGLRRRQDVACTTFGSPMPGNSVFRDRYERMVETHWRFEFASDPVSKLPGILNFTPVGVRVLLDQAGWLMIDPSLVEVQWWGRLANPLVAQKLHFRASYVRGLQLFAARHKDGGDDLRECFWPFPIECQVRGLFPREYLQ